MTQPSAVRSHRRPRLSDRFALWLLKLAKLRRRNFTEPAGEDYDKFYESFFEQRDVEAYEKDRRMTVRRETISNFLSQKLPPPARILDVGCGLGDVLAGLPNGYELLGIDYAQFNVKVAAQRLAGKARIERGSIYEMPYNSNSTDACLCLEVLEHIEDDARAVREIARVLKPRGLLLAAVPYTFYWPDYMRLMGHFRHYTRQTFSSLMDQNGLKTIQYLPNYPNWHQRFTKRYTFIRAEAMTLGRLTGKRSPYAFQWPWRARPAIEQLAEKLEPMRQRDAQLDYSQLETSTFLVAQKP